MSKPRFVVREIHAEEYNQLRRSVGWRTLPFEVIRRGIEASLYSICVEANQTIVGHGRIIGDGAIYFYIQDLIVHPFYQHQRLGSKIMEALMAYLKTNAPDGAFIGLMAAPRLDRFYQRYGFKSLPDNEPGMGIWVGAAGKGKRR